MSNKYLEKIAESYSLAPHPFHREYGGIDHVSLNRDELRKYESNGATATSGRRIAGSLLGGAAIGAGLARGAAHFAKRPDLKGVATAMGGLVGMTVGAHTVNRHAHEQGLASVGAAPEWIVEDYNRKYKHLEKASE